MDKYLVSPNPHVHAAVSSDSLMRDVIIALLPAIVVSVVFYGWSELLVLAVGALSCTRGRNWESETLTSSPSASQSTRTSESVFMAYLPSSPVRARGARRSMS